MAAGSYDIYRHPNETASKQRQAIISLNGCGYKMKVNESHINDSGSIEIGKKILESGERGERGVGRIPYKISPTDRGWNSPQYVNSTQFSQITKMYACTYGKVAHWKCTA